MPCLHDPGTLTVCTTPPAQAKANLAAPRTCQSHRTLLLLLEVLWRAVAVDGQHRAAPRPRSHGTNPCFDYSKPPNQTQCATTTTQRLCTAPQQHVAASTHHRAATLTIASPTVSLQPCLPLLPQCRRACHGRHRVLPTWESPRPSRWLDDSLNALGHAHEPACRLAEPSPLRNASAATPSLHVVAVARATHGAVPFRPSIPGTGSTTTKFMSAMPWNARSHRL